MSSTIPRVGTQMAGYRIQGLIGRGGMSVVYLAEHIRLGRKVALKILAPELAEDEAFRERFVRESQMAAQLDHPNVIPIFEADEADGLLFIAMRYVDGKDLKALIAQEGALAPERALSIIAQVGGALDAAHAAGLVHRDVKPANILVTPVGRSGTEHAYLSDFGLVKHTISRSGITRTGQFVGTLDYVSPEQVQGNPVDHRADIYSLGCVLFETLTGRVPFPREGDAAVMWAHVWEPPPSARAHRPDLPPALDRMVAKAMAKSPDDRYQTAEDMTAEGAEALAPPSSLPETAHPPATGLAVTETEQAVPSSPTSAALPPTVTDADQVAPAGPFVPSDSYPPPPPSGPAAAQVPARSTRPWHRHPAALAAVVALVLLVLIGGGYLLFGGERERATPPDTRPPETAIAGEHVSSVPEGEGVVFEFTSSEPGSSFECAIDGASSFGCTSPHRVPPLEPGEHSFTIVATDQAGNTDPTPVTHTFTVEGTATDDLLDHIPVSQYTECEPETEDLPAGTVEAYYCFVGDYEAYYYLFDSDGSMADYVQQGIEYYGLEEGDCGAGRFGYGEWVYNAAPTVNVGDLLCGVTEDGFTAVESSLWAEEIYLEVYGGKDQPLNEVFNFWSGVVPS